jgi:hypothetical protein
MAVVDWRPFSVLFSVAFFSHDNRFLPYYRSSCMNWRYGVSTISYIHDNNIEVDMGLKCL